MHINMKMLFDAAYKVLTAYIPVAFIMSHVYGWVIDDAYNRDSCTKWFYDRHDLNQNIGMAIFFAAVGAFSLSFTMSNTNILSWKDWFNMKSWWAFLAQILGCASLITVYFAVFTGSCSSATVADANGYIDFMVVFAGITMALLLSFAFLHLGVISFREKDEGDYYLIYEDTQYLFLIGWLLRVAVAGLFIRIMWENNRNDAYNNYGNTALSTTLCLNAENDALQDTTKPERETFERIALFYVNYPTGAAASLVLTPNWKMLGAAWAIIGMESVVFLFVLLEFVSRMFNRSIPFFSSYKRYFITVSRALTLVSMILIAILVFSLIMLNDVAACPVLDPEKWTVNALLWVVILIIIHGYTCYLYKTLRINSKTTIESAKEGYTEVDSIEVDSTDKGKGMVVEAASRMGYSAIPTNKERTSITDY